ncbi:hypothetical protein I552_2675 [Mycobacterium xenopi 3993]|nr:hypothetical protein I552_2675 [Mycobacterium xenopi 3993]
MYFVGVDLAWGEISQSGVAVVDADGRLVHLGTAHDDASIENTLSAYVRDDCLVALDAPLVVNNPAGHRPCDRALNRDFGRFEAGARPAYTGRPEFSSVPAGPDWPERSPWTSTRTPRPSGERSRCTHIRPPWCCSAWIGR